MSLGYVYRRGGAAAGVIRGDGEPVLGLLLLIEMIGHERHYRRGLVSREISITGALLVFVGLSAFCHEFGIEGAISGTRIFVGVFYCQTPYGHTVRQEWCFQLSARPNVKENDKSKHGCVRMF